MLAQVMYKYMAILAFMVPVWCTAQVPDEEVEANYYQEIDTMMAVRHAIKFDPLHIFIGDFQLYYEHMVGERWSIEVGFGPTRRNFTASMFDYELDNFGNNIDVHTRYAASLWLKRYFWNTDELYGPYMGVNVHHRRHDKTFNVLNSSGELTGNSFTDSRIYTGLMLVGGYQMIPLQSNIFVDFHVGIGARYRDFDVVRSTDLFNPQAYEVRSETSIRAAVQFGVKIGYGF